MSELRGTMENNEVKGLEQVRFDAANLYLEGPSPTCASVRFAD